MGECTLIFHYRNKDKEEFHPLRIYTRSGILLYELGVTFSRNISYTMISNSRYIKIELKVEKEEYIIFFNLGEYLHFEESFGSPPDNLSFKVTYHYDDNQSLLEESIGIFRILEGVYPYFSSDDYHNIMYQLFKNHTYKKGRFAMELENIYSIKFKNFNFDYNTIDFGDGAYSDEWKLIIEKGEEKKIFNLNQYGCSPFLIRISQSYASIVNSEAKKFIGNVSIERNYFTGCIRGRKYSSFVIRNIILPHLPKEALPL